MVTVLYILAVNIRYAVVQPGISYLTFFRRFLFNNHKTQLFRNVPLERWAMEENGRFSVTNSETTLNNFYAYPEIFAIEDDICS